MSQERSSTSQDNTHLHLDASIQAEAWLALWQANDLKVLDIRRIDIIVRQCEVWLAVEVRRHTSTRDDLNQ
jgi:hypothetical protein